MLYRFLNFIVDADRFEVSHKGEVISLQPQAMRLLLLLLEADGRLVTKQEIVQSLWDGRAISDSAITSQVKALRRAFGETSRPYSILGTVHGEGYRILCRIERQSSPTCAHDPSEPGALAAMDSGGADRRGQKPSIAVLPFRLLAPSESHVFLADALPDEIIAALSRLRSLNVIARGSSFQFSEIVSTPVDLREQLGADYVLTGSIEVSAGQITIMMNLVDTNTESVIWSEHLSKPGNDIDGVRGSVASRIASEVENHVPQNESRTLEFKLAEDLTAWESYHVGMTHLMRGGPSNVRTAQRRFQDAINIDPAFSRAYAALSHTHWWTALQNTYAGSGADERAMVEAAQAAIEYDPYDPSAHLAMGRSLALTFDHEGAVDWLERGIELAPSYVWSHNQLATYRAFLGPYEIAMKHGLKALSLSPRDPFRHSMYAALAIASLNRGDVEEAAEWGRKTMSVPHRDLMVMLTAMSTNHIAGHRDVAKEVALKVKKLFPKITIEGVIRSNPQMAEEAIVGTRKMLKRYGIG